MASGSKKVIIAALIGNALIACTKFVAAVFTGSSAMLSEGIHSLVDTGNQVLLLYGMKRASKPADEDFPFGHGKEIYFWSFVVAILIFALGGGVSLYQGIQHVIHPVEITDPMINYIVLGLALVFEGAALYFALREFNKTKGESGYIEAVARAKDPSVFVVLFEDSAAMLGLIVAFVGILLTQLTGLLYLDGLASIIIGLILIGTAVWLAYETKGLLIGEAANKPLVQGIRDILKADTKIDNVNEVLTMHMGPNFVLANISVDFDDQLSAADVENCIADINQEIKLKHPLVQRVFIEAERSKEKENANERK